MQKVSKLALTGLFISFSIFLTTQVYAQGQVQQLEARVANLEEYVQKLQPTLNAFSKDLLSNVDMQITTATGKIAVINPVSRKFGKLETNAGIFLIAVDKMEKLEDGYRLHLQIGNPHTATFSGLRLAVRWGKKWNPSFVKTSYKDWRNSLMAAEYTSKISLKSGTWSTLIVDLRPADQGQIGHIECEMEVSSIKLLTEGAY